MIRQSIDGVLTELQSAARAPNEKALRFILSHMTGGGKRWESSLIDFKECFEGDRRAWLRLLAEGAALTNSGGGTLVFGVDDDGNRIGVDRSLANQLDPTKISNQLQNFVSGIEFETVVVSCTYYKKHFVGLYFLPNPGIIVFDKDGDYPDAGGTKRVFQHGVVYVRRGTAKQAATQLDINLLIRRLADEQSRSLLARIEQVAFLPRGTSLIAEASDGSGAGVRLVGHGRGIPVGISDTGDAATDVAQFIDTSRPYDSLATEIAHRVRLWKQAEHEASVPKSSLNRWLLHRDEIDWDDEACELAVRSALHCRSFPNFWARKLPRVRLAALAHEVAQAFNWPDRGDLPYLICAQLWDDRGRLFDQLRTDRDLTHMRPSKDLLSRLEAIGHQEFLLNGRAVADSFTFGGERFSLRDLSDNPATAVKLFDLMLDEDGQDGGATVSRSTIHQLDIALHGGRQ